MTYNFLKIAFILLLCSSCELGDSEVIASQNGIESNTDLTEIIGEDFDIEIEENFFSKSPQEYYSGDNRVSFDQKDVVNRQKEFFKWKK